ncbi:cupin domain-containing protein [Dolichospermum sp. ST_con]|nr:cupin domain-containing protein [Dolichospermum sp. ST_con]MDD1421245.1 cupin domain-containing protein [Dolichospermum sp. ST_sed1]MDD1424341.1 cupin domain-containing protein [Dolichospermum sp. ST_sed9]MDD1430803.1 cupin domain-containing protein [Dolichospermum sp. ST_sed6]MDD1436916.1 cupin domain-containing protein [Dolichospermum sp. ST_sed10]MDD1442260.1 cupin domain-containing protein [Dolichospermum sp. ST_sed3]MDD1448052.1 cupin domain-containing protein [Dolichospermum sp. ST_s
MEIKVEHQPSLAYLNNLDVFNWPIWEKEISTFPWTYDDQETCYFLAGNVIVTPNGGQAVKMGEGDLVTFPAGMSCTWEITSDVKKHYCFD